MFLKHDLSKNVFELHEPLTPALTPEMHWLRTQLLEGAASDPGEPFSKEYFRNLVNRRKSQGNQQC